MDMDLNIENMYSIGKLAKKVGISVSTLRRWDRSGALRPVLVTEGGHRRYTEQAVLDILDKTTVVDVSEVKREIRHNNEDALGLSALDATTLANTVQAEIVNVLTQLKELEAEQRPLSRASDASSNPSLKSLMTKQLLRLEGDIALKLNQLNKIAVYGLHAIWTQHREQVGIVETCTMPSCIHNTLEFKGVFGTAIPLLITHAYTNNDTLQTKDARRLDKKCTLHTELDFDEFLRRIDFYYIDRGVSYRALARKYGLL